MLIPAVLQILRKSISYPKSMLSIAVIALNLLFLTSPFGSRASTISNEIFETSLPETILSGYELIEPEHSSLEDGDIRTFSSFSKSDVIEISGADIDFDEDTSNPILEHDWQRFRQQLKQSYAGIREDYLKSILDLGDIRFLLGHPEIAETGKPQTDNKASRKAENIIRPTFILQPQTGFSPDSRNFAFQGYQAPPPRAEAPPKRSTLNSQQYTYSRSGSGTDSSAITRPTYNNRGYVGGGETVPLLYQVWHQILEWQKSHPFTFFIVTLTLTLYIMIKMILWFIGIFAKGS